MGALIASLIVMRFRIRHFSRYLEGIIEATSDAIIVTNDEGSILRCNPATSKIMGLSREKLLQLHLSDILSHPKLLMGPFLSSMRGGDLPENLEFNFETLNRGLVPALLSARVLERESRQTKEFVFLVKDIGDLKEAQERLEEQRAVSINSAKLATLGEMAGGIAHEVNNPLSVIMGYAAKIERLQKKGLLDSIGIEESTKAIKKTTMRIAKIISAMRMLARDGSNDSMEKEGILSIIDDSLELCREKILRFNIELKLNFPEDDIEVDCRAVQIGQVLLNLVSNSIDAVKEVENAWIEISIETSPDSEFVRICVTDSGHGIPEALRERVLQPFFTTKEVGQGTGLGLSISRRIVESHQGRFLIDHEHAHTRFVVELPVNRVSDDLQSLAYGA